QDILARLRRYAGGVTVVLIAYRTATIMLADTVLHLDGGRVVDHGSHTELLGRDAGYRRLVTTYRRERQARDPQEVRLARRSRPPPPSACSARCGKGCGCPRRC